MPTAHETTLYDVNDCKVYPLLTDVVGASPTYGAAVDVPGIANVSLDPNLVTAELKGDARVIAKKGKIDKFNVQATYGKLSLDVLKVILGGTVTSASGSAKYSFSGANKLTYFKIEFAIDDAEVGQVVVRLHKAQLTGGTLLGQQTDQFGQPTMSLEGIPCEGNVGLFVDIEFLDVPIVLGA